MEGTVLIIDDDARLRGLVREYLEGYGYAVHERADGRDAATAVAELRPDIVVLDVMMPGRDGMEVLGDIRAASGVPVVMLTARGDETDRVIGLELGADDYVPKPFSPRELLARIKAVLRRASRGADPSGGGPVEAGGLVLDPDDRTLVASGERMVLPPTECRLMEALMRHAGRAMSRDELMDMVWGKEFMAADRSIDVHVSKLRAVLGRFPEHASRIQTVWGVGYRFGA